ncbi:hypothetical protein EXW62_23075 [Bacillus mycoides]|nr:hypothetical protein EXW62_23075 [Bacillus mycoides]
MPIIRDIRLSFLKRKENISSLEVLKLTSSSNYDEEISFLIEEIKSGKKFEQGIEYTNIIEGYPVSMKSFIELDREVLRVLLPDKKGILRTALECDEYYKAQLDIIEES